MSFHVDKSIIKRFKSDRSLLPYDDTIIAEKMGVDRSNYSKAVNKGPITNVFLAKFYGAFLTELITVKEQQKAASPNSGDGQAESLLSRLDKLLVLVDGLIAGQKELKAQVDSLDKEMDKVLERIPKIESLITQLAMYMAPGII